MINQKFIQKLKKDYQKNESERRQIISLSNVILHDSKRVIFSLHRGDIGQAEGKLNEIEAIIKKLDAKFGVKRVQEEGAYKAAIEEFVEAKTFYLFIKKQTINNIKGLSLGYESYLGGLCDLTGELIRYAINSASKGNLAEVERSREAIDDIMKNLIEFDMTGYLRTKYDQAKMSLRKIEQINYEIKLRKNC